ncbi:hypothetical protein HRR77_007167 [Exophiala dermatitidis]|nr:hypothetical protein HRR77_007167 [Exophiala dermatitidis]KAJ4577487.1 hypothetical protein HRR82_005362 [Exophiala dermatitidis]
MLEPLTAGRAVAVVAVVAVVVAMMMVYLAFLGATLTRKIESTRGLTLLSFRWMRAAAASFAGLPMLLVLMISCVVFGGLGQRWLTTSRLVEAIARFLLFCLLLLWGTQRDELNNNFNSWMCTTVQPLAIDVPFSSPVLHFTPMADFYSSQIFLPILSISAWRHQVQLHIKLPEPPLNETYQDLDGGTISDAVVPMVGILKVL